MLTTAASPQPSNNKDCVGKGKRKIYSVDKYTAHCGLINARVILCVLDAAIVYV